MNPTQKQFSLDRAAWKFNVLQSVAITELEDHSDPNAYGHLSFVDLGVTKPSVKDGPRPVAVHTRRQARAQISGTPV